MFTIKQNWRDVKPPIGSQIYWSHPLSQGLVGCWLMNEGGGNVINNLIFRKDYGSTLYLLSGAKFKSSQVGLVPFYDGVSNYTKGNWTQDLTNKFTLVYSTYNPSSRIINLCRVESSRYIIQILDTLIFFQTTVTDEQLNYTTNLTSFGVSHNAFTCGGNKDYKTYLNGRSNGSLTLSGTLGNSLSDTITLGCKYESTPTLFGKCSIGYVYIYSRALSPSEIQSLYIDPYQFIQPIRRRFFSIPASGTTSAPQATSLISSRHLQLLGVG